MAIWFQLTSKPSGRTSYYPVNTKSTGIESHSMGQIRANLACNIVEHPRKNIESSMSLGKKAVIFIFAAATKLFVTAKRPTALSSLCLFHYQLWKHWDSH
jgi:hypothetical protein